MGFELWAKTAKRSDKHNERWLLTKREQEQNK